MTSQHQPHQKTQDDQYTNQDDKPHEGPVENNDRQPGPKQEKELPLNPQPVPETRPDAAPKSDAVTPEKNLRLLIIDTIIW